MTVKLNVAQPTAENPDPIVGRCDKCNQLVPFSNNAFFIDAVLTGNAFLLLAGAARHLLAVDGCEGSPSRAQYLEGQPLDSRQELYPRIESGIEPTRKAYAEMQQLVAQAHSE